MNNYYCFFKEKIFIFRMERGCLGVIPWYYLRQAYELKIGRRGHIQPLMALPTVQHPLTRLHRLKMRRRLHFLIHRQTRGLLRMKIRFTFEIRLLDWVSCSVFFTKVFVWPAPKISISSIFHIPLFCTDPLCYLGYLINSSLNKKTVQMILKFIFIINCNLQMIEEFRDF